MAVAGPTGRKAFCLDSSPPRVLDGGGQGLRIEAATRLDGGAEFPGLVIELVAIWAG